MLSGIPKLLGRGFLVGFLLPATVYYVLISIILADNQLISSDFWKQIAKLDNAAPSALIILFSAVLLMALNRSIVRLLEGYPIESFFASLKRRLGPDSRFCRQYESHKLKKFIDEIDPVLKEMERLEKEREAKPDATSNMPNFQRESLMAIRYFPDQAQHVLPTRFGNAMRAFEVYSRVVYGLESIQTWSRLALILPQRVLDRVEERRTPLDFNINMIALSLPTCGLIVCLSIRYTPANLWWLIAPVSVLLFCWANLPNLAVQWGDLVKSTFDLFRVKLAREMGLTLPDKPSEEREMWVAASRMMIYRRPRATDALAPFRRRRVKARSAKPPKEQPPAK